MLRGVEVGHGMGRVEAPLTQHIAGLFGGREQRVLRNGGGIGLRVGEDGLDVSGAGEHPHVQLGGEEHRLIRAQPGQRRIGVGEVLRSERIEVGRHRHGAPPGRSAGVFSACTEVAMLHNL